MANNNTGVLSFAEFNALYMGMKIMDSLTLKVYYKWALYAQYKNKRGFLQGLKTNPDFAVVDKTKEDWAYWDGVVKAKQIMGVEYHRTK